MESTIKHKLGQLELQDLSAKQDTLVSGTNIKTIEGKSLLGSGNIDLVKSDFGLSNVDNTSDANKPISTAQQTALDLKENSFAKNTAFNKNFGTAAGTVVEGNDSRVLNGQTAFGWGKHAGLYPSLTGTGASGNWNINSASVTNGVYTTGDQTINGIKTFNSTPRFNSGSIVLYDSAADGDARITIDDSLFMFTDCNNRNTFNTWQGGLSIYKTNSIYVNLLADNLSAYRDIYLPNANGTLALTSDLTTKANLASPTFTGTPTAPTPTVGTNTTQLATTAFVLANSSARPYKVYTALLSQSGTSAPTATVLENTLGGTVVWTRNSTGLYTGTLAGVFTANKTWTSITSTATGTVTGAVRTSVDAVTVATSSLDSALTNSAIEIRVYN